MQLYSFFLLSFLVASCFCLTFHSEISLERQHRLGWHLAGDVDPTETVHVLFALKRQNMDILEKIVWEVSDPRSPSYGNHLTLEELANLVGRSDEDLNLVLNWLEANGIKGATASNTRDWIIVDTTIELLEQLLQCDMAVYKNRVNQHTVYRARSSYVIPDELTHVINFVAGLHGFPYASWVPVPTLSAAVGANTPNDIIKLYDITVPTGSCGCTSSQAVVEFSSANYSPSDLQTFFTQYAPDLKGQTVRNVYGTNNPDGHISVEANLDVQYIMAIGAFIDTDDYVEPINPNIIESFLKYTQQVLDQTNPPLVHSISWGEYGGDYDNSTVQQVNQGFMMMSSRGISVSVASGDNGVGCGDLCTSQEFDFPSSPYVTMVGATQLNPSGSEGGASFSSGGFSRDYSRPSWQDEAVTGYLDSGVSLPSINYDKNGRAYPDVSALGVNLEVVVNGKSEPVDGTSCSAPIFAGIISLLNAQRAAQSLSPLGWLNPWLYQNPQMFTDITTGVNSYLCCKGFSATTGWDPVTGLGTPIYPKMLSAALAAGKRQTQ